MSAYANTVIIGLLIGSSYALVGSSITLMFKTTGVLSLAHAAFATAAAYLYSELRGDWGWPTPVAVAGAVAVTVAYGLGVERVVMRPIRGTTATMKMIATLGVLALTTGLMLLWFGFDPVRAPQLFPDRFIRIGDLGVSYAQLATFSLAVTAMGALTAFLYRTRLGLQVRAMASNGEAARLMGVSEVNIARFNWGLGALLAGVAGVLLAPNYGILTAATLTLVVVRALAATLFGGLDSLALTFAGGLFLGVVEAVATLEFSAPGSKELAVLVVVVVLLSVRRTWATDGVREGLDTLRSAVRLAGMADRAADAFRQMLGPAMLPAALLGVAFLVAAPLQSDYWAAVGVLALVYVIESLSLVLLVGWGGQVSLMHGAYVGIGAFTAARLFTIDGWPLAAAILAAGLAGVVLGALAGVPALRLSGMQFAIASLAFSGAISEWLFRRPGLSQSLPPGKLFGLDLFEPRNLFLVMAAVTAVFYVLVWNYRRSAVGTVLRATRDAATTMQHFGVSTGRVRMEAFGLASFIAATGGAFYGIFLTRFSPFQFSVLLSISLLVYAVVGGVESLLGPILAGVLFGVVPQVIQGSSGPQTSALPDVLAGFGLLAVVVLRPAGLVSLIPRRGGGSGSSAARSTPAVAQVPEAAAG